MRYLRDLLQNRDMQKQNLATQTCFPHILNSSVQEINISTVLRKRKEIVYIAIDFVSSSKPQFQKLVKTIAINIFISLFFNLLTLYVSFVYYNFISFRFLYSAMLFYEASCTVTVFLSALAGRNFRSVDPLVPVL